MMNAGMQAIWVIGASDIHWALGFGHWSFCQHDHIVLGEPHFRLLHMLIARDELRLDLEHAQLEAAGRAARCWAISPR
jgi:hypothetical protein